jgi:hypothetical protein
MGGTGTPQGFDFDFFEAYMRGAAIGAALSAKFSVKVTCRGYGASRWGHCAPVRLPETVARSNSGTRPRRSSRTWGRPPSGRGQAPPARGGTRGGRQSAESEHRQVHLSMNALASLGRGMPPALWRRRKLASFYNGSREKIGQKYAKRVNKSRPVVVSAGPRRLKCLCSILGLKARIAQRDSVMGIIPLWLFPNRRTLPRCAIVVGNRQFRFYVASDAQQRIELERLFGSRSDSADHRCPALLIPYPANARGPAAVAVRIEGTIVGYLHLTAAREFLTALSAVGADRAACAAMIMARWDPGLGDRTHFRVRLDVATPFKFLDPQIEPAARKHA